MTLDDHVLHVVRRSTDRAYGLRPHDEVAARLNQLSNAELVETLAAAIEDWWDEKEAYIREQVSA